MSLKEYLKNNDLQGIRSLAKGEVHNHCGLGNRFTTFHKYTNGKAIKPPKEMVGIEGLDAYIFGELIKVEYLNL